MGRMPRNSLNFWIRVHYTTLNFIFANLLLELHTCQIEAFVSLPFKVTNVTRITCASQIVSSVIKPDLV